MSEEQKPLTETPRAPLIAGMSRISSEVNAGQSEEELLLEVAGRLKLLLAVVTKASSGS
jgi:hypothetical protein